MSFVSSTRRPSCLIPVSRVTINSTWNAYVIGSLTTSVREIQSLYMSQYSGLFPFVLNPRKYLEDFRGIAGATNLCTISNTGQLGDATMASIQSAYGLNPSQLQALTHALTARQGLVLLQGPPGTGKTKTVIALLAFLFHKQKALLQQKRDKAAQPPPHRKVLVCAPSNAAVDEIAARVLKEGLAPVFQEFGASATRDPVFPKCVRIGHPKRITRSEVLAISLTEAVRRESAITDQEKRSDYQVKKASLVGDIEATETALRETEVLRDAARFKNAFAESVAEEGPAEEWHLAQKFNTLLKKKRLIQQQIGRLREQQDKDLQSTKSACQQATLGQADIVFATLSGSASECLMGTDIECVIVDEAAQAVELSTLIPLRLEPSRFILIGDPQQLPATVISQVARRLAYERSLFQRLQLCGVEVRMLSVQYRMHPQIAHFPAAHFYEGQLSNAPSVLTRPPALFHSWSSLFGPFVFFDIASQENRHSVSQSLSNKEEAFFIVSLLRLFRKHFITHRGANALQQPPGTVSSPTLSWRDVAVVTPYKQQASNIRQLFSTWPSEFSKDDAPEVCTVDAFQGREKRVIVFSCVRSDWVAAHDTQRGTNDRRNVAEGSSPVLSATAQREALGFVADVRRMNVAITRAQEALWIVGNAQTLQKNPSWKALIDYARGKPFAQYGKAEAAGISAVAVTQFSTSVASRFVSVLNETAELQKALRPPAQRKVLHHVATPNVISWFFSLSEECHLQQAVEGAGGAATDKPQRSARRRVLPETTPSSQKLDNCPTDSGALSSCSSVSDSNDDEDANDASVISIEDVESKGHHLSAVPPPKGKTLKTTQLPGTPTPSFHLSVTTQSPSNMTPPHRKRAASKACLSRGPISPGHDRARVPGAPPVSPLKSRASILGVRGKRHFHDTPNVSLASSALSQRQRRVMCVQQPPDPDALLIRKIKKPRQIEMIDALPPAPRQQAPVTSSVPKASHAPAPLLSRASRGALHTRPGIRSCYASGVATGTTAKAEMAPRRVIKASPVLEHLAVSSLELGNPHSRIKTSFSRFSGVGGSISRPKQVPEARNPS